MHACMICHKHFLPLLCSSGFEAPGVQLAEFAAAVAQDDLERGFVRDDPVVSSLSKASSKNAAPWQRLDVATLVWMLRCVDVHTP